MKDYEEVSSFVLAEEDRENLLKTRNECVFVWRRATPLREP